MQWWEIRHHLVPRDTYWWGPETRLRQFCFRIGCFSFSFLEVFHCIRERIVAGSLAFRVSQLEEEDNAHRFCACCSYQLIDFHSSLFFLCPDICWCNCFDFPVSLHSVIRQGKNKYIPFMMKNKYKAEFAAGWQEWLEIKSTRPNSRDARHHQPEFWE